LRTQKRAGVGLQYEVVNPYMVKVAFHGEHFQYVRKHVDTAINANEPLISWNREMFATSVQKSHVLWVYTLVSSTLSF
jgi:hypothetical protein